MKLDNLIEYTTETYKLIEDSTISRQKRSNTISNTLPQEYRRQELKERTGNLMLNIMLVGPTGAGKSSTINALIGKEDADVGYGADPKTKQIKSFRLNSHIKLWDTPGLGDSPEEDSKHINKIISLLHRDCSKSNTIYGKKIDLVLVIIDGSGRDMGTVFSCVKRYIMPVIEHNNILFAVNQADMAMKGRHFDTEQSRPDKTLTEFLNKQGATIQHRIEESVGLKINKPVIFSALYHFNLTGLLDLIIDNPEWKMRKSRIYNTGYQREETIWDILEDFFDSVFG